MCYFSSSFSRLTFNRYYNHFIWLIRFQFNFATEGKILVEDIVKLGSETEDADTAEAGKS